MWFLIYSVLDLIFKIYMNSYLYIELDNIEISKLFKYTLVELHLNILKLFHFFRYVPVRMFLFNYKKNYSLQCVQKVEIYFLLLHYLYGLSASWERLTFCDSESNEG